MRERRGAVGNEQRVELDEAVALLLVIADDLCARRQLVADLAAESSCIFVPT